MSLLDKYSLTPLYFHLESFFDECSASRNSVLEEKSHLCNRSTKQEKVFESIQDYKLWQNKMFGNVEGVERHNTERYG